MRPMELAQDSSGESSKYVLSDVNENFKCLNILRFILHQIYKGLAIAICWVLLRTIQYANYATIEDEQEAENQKEVWEGIIGFLIFCWTYSLIMNIRELWYGSYFEQKNRMWIPCIYCDSFLPLCILKRCCNKDCLKALFTCNWYYSSCMMCLGGLRNPITNPSIFVRADDAYEEIYEDTC